MNYYINEEPEACFAAVNENDVAVGYVICAVDFGRYEEIFRRKYSMKTFCLIAGMTGKETADALRPYASSYSAQFLNPQNSGSGRFDGAGNVILRSVLPSAV